MDRLAAGDFIRSLFTDVGGPVELTAIRNGRVVPDFLLGDECLADELSYVLPDLERLNEQGYAIYYGVSTKRASWVANGGRGDERFAWRLPAFWADVDLKRHEDEDLAAMFKRLHRFDPQPSLIVFTGGGLQALWLLDEPLECEDYLAHWKNVNRGLQQAVGSDPVQDAGRLLRLPGSINHKYDAKPMATVMWHGWGTRYAPEVFERFRIAEPKPALRVPLPADTRLDVPDWIQDFMRQPPAVGQRNETLYRMAATLKDYGWSVGEVLGLLEGFAGLPERETQRTISSAFNRPPRGVRPTRDVTNAMLNEEWS